MEVEILKKSGVDLRARGIEARARRYEYIDGQRSRYPLRVMCGCLKASAKAYYGWLERKSVRKERSDLRETAVRIAVTEKFYFHKRRNGSKRLSDELKDSGIEAGRYLTRWINAGRGPGRETAKAVQAADDGLTRDASEPEPAERVGEH